MPCPKTLIDLAWSCLSMLLLLCGDIKQNSCPKVKDTLQKLLEGQKEIREDIKVIQADQSSFSSELNKLNPRMSEIEKTMKVVKRHDEKLTRLVTTLKEMANTIEAQREKMADLKTAVVETILQCLVSRKVLMKLLKRLKKSAN